MSSSMKRTLIDCAYVLFVIGFTIFAVWLLTTPPNTTGCS